MTRTAKPLVLPATASDNLERCLKCGLCREVCPAFRALGEERYSPRGRLALLAAAAEGEDYGAAFRDALDYCLACRACAERCPSGVAGDVLVLAARAAGLCRGGLPFVKSWAFRLALPRPGAMAALLKTLFVCQRLGVLPAALAVIGLPGRPRFPRLEGKPFDAGAATTMPVAGGGEKRGRVFYFVGCAANYLYPATARAVVALLTRAGYEVIVPAARRCCGVPALANGDVALARRLAAANVAALAGDEPVVVDCGSCGVALTLYYADVLGVAGAEGLKARVRDFTQLVPAAAVPAGDGAPVAYHDPCHLARGLGVRAEPRALLRRRGALVEVESTGGVSCCGGAGAYGLAHADVRNYLGEERAAAIAATGAAVVATGCAACVFYLNDALARRGAAARVRHTAEVLADGGAAAKS
jgi:glycolate oxidase iron-sulfur subunit